MTKTDRPLPDASVLVTTVATSVATLEESKASVGEAETELESALAALALLPRAEKQAVSRAVESAIHKLRAARDQMTAAEDLLVSAVPEADPKR